MMKLWLLSFGSDLMRKEKGKGTQYIYYIYVAVANELQPQLTTYLRRSVTVEG